MWPLIGSFFVLVCMDSRCFRAGPGSPRNPNEQPKRLTGPYAHRRGPRDGFDSLRPTRSSTGGRTRCEVRNRWLRLLGEERVPWALTRPSGRSLGMSLCSHRFLVIAACYADWAPGVFSKTARKRQIGPNGLLASTARTFSNTCVFAVFCSFRPYVVIGALTACLHQHELVASTVCTFSKHVSLMIFVKTQPLVVIGAPLPIS